MSNLGPKWKHLKNSLRLSIKCFKDKIYPTNKLFYNNKILKIAGYIKLLNCLFIKSILSNIHLPIFENLLKKAGETHTANSVFLPQPQTGQYRKFSITYQTVFTWNDREKNLGINMLEESNSKVKTALVQLYFNNYLN